ncbi:DUF4097 domain-containing protein [Spongiivirga citrea]|uniref:Adhesin domain-containing protein n=1 Tax=Spongiivirga citrea TaxID=1481457 RepID=A0A6M0CGZ5_9FLAO|nr:DUF4097 domain-containing protein [Spongiivirga citrea]NER17161.1 hypothetical protein [Spongiivirga citrea]
MRYLVILLCCLLGVQIGFSQNTVVKTISTFGVNKVDFDIDKVFDLQLATGAVDQIELEVQTEGEHSDQLVVSANQHGDVITISVDYHAGFKNFNDKLSAHKVISAKMIVTIPEKKQVQITSDIANAQVKGKFDNLIVDLRGGNFVGRDFYGDATINTYNGKIALETNFAQVVIKSTSGKIIKQNLTPGPNIISLKTVNGPIVVTTPNY